MTIKVGSLVVVTASNESVRGQGCNEKIVNGGKYVVLTTDGDGCVALADCSFNCWIKADGLELADQYTDEDWV